MRKYLCMCIIMLPIIATACSNEAVEVATTPPPADSPVISYEITENNIYERMQADEALLTAEEFIELLEEYGDVLGLSMEDFENLDIDWVIRKRGITPTLFDWYITENQRFLKHWVDYYNGVRLSSEEFLQLVEEYSSFLELSASDFDDIDIDEFISYQGLTTREAFLDFYIHDDGSSLGASLWIFIESKPRRDAEAQAAEQIAPYLVRELQYVDSTNEEFREFIDKYLETIDYEIERDYWDYYDTDYGPVYTVILAGKEQEGAFRLSFLQTCKSKNWNISRGEKDNLDYYRIYVIDVIDGETGYWDTIFYSKCGRFLIYDIRYSDSEGEGFNIIKTFCEMDG